ncbi:MAG: hypothetical protein NVS1B5_06780 [Gemmatimonadaceae bacterium]
MTVTPPVRRRSILGLVIVLAPALVTGQEPPTLVMVQAPPACDSTWREASIGSLSGRTIADVKIVTSNPMLGPGPLALVSAAHVQTKPWAIRRMLGVTIGGRLDTLEVAEGIRRIRASKEFDHVALEERGCEGSDSVDLRLVTQDLWSAGIDARLTASSEGSLTITERNFLGTTRSVTAGIAAADNRLGYTFRLKDPTLFRGHALLGARYDAYSDGKASGESFETRSGDPRPPWRLWINFSRSHRSVARDSSLTVVPRPPDSTALDTTVILDSLYQPIHEGYDLHRRRASVLVARRLFVVDERGVYIFGGTEDIRDDLHVAPEKRVLGAQDVTRWFRGTSVGLGVKSINYSQVSWYASRGDPLDIPMGFEAETIVSIGREKWTNQPMQHLDAWAGRAWHPAESVVASTDVWASGFRSDSAGTAHGALRVAGDMVIRAEGGFWTAHAAMESIRNPDPDEHALASDDPIRLVVAPRSHLSESARVIYLERSVRLGKELFSRPLAIALFGAGSKRTGTLDPNFDDLVVTSAAVAGLGLRLLPRAPGDGTLRLDLGRTLANSPLVSHRWYVTAGFAAAFGSNRRRDGWNHP